MPGLAPTDDNPTDNNPTDDLLARIAWSRLTEPGDPVAGALIAALGARAALDWLATSADLTPPSQVPDPRWRKAADNWRARLEGLDPRRDYDNTRTLGGVVVVPGQAAWPTRLDDLGSHAPLCLWVRGDPGVLSQAGIGIVGARACTRYGEQVAAELASGAVARGLTVVSGGAFGIDAAAHRAALAAGGTTIAFQAGGVDRYYPVAHRELLTRVAGAGAVVSEAPLGSAPMRQRFLMRNRLIAAVSIGVIVVEASWRSGALNTARHAAGLLRPVGAVPGPVTSMASAGCHRIIREGMAVCVTDVEDLMELVGPFDAAGADPETPAGLLDGLEPASARVLDALPVRAGMSTDRLVRAAGLAPGVVLTSLGNLQMLGRVDRVEGLWRRTR